MHEGIRFSCEQCDYKATSRANLKKHVQGRHAARTLPCDYCDEYVGKPTWPRLLDIYVWLESTSLGRVAPLQINASDK